MSIILDALKKSETDSQRQSGPALFEVKVAPPKARFPIWAVAIAALLVINMVIVGWLLLRPSTRADETAAQNTPPATASGSPSVATPPPRQSGAPPYAASNASGPANNGAPPTFAPPPTALASAPQSAAMSPAAEETNPRPGRLPDSDQNEPTLAGTPPDPGASPDDYAPATDPGTPLFKGHVQRGSVSGLMLYQDLAVAAGSNLPQLRLDLHVYAPKPQDRFALINMHKVHEGDSLEGGVRVETITPDGVEMSHSGTKFLLPKE